jgi:hypothetical protein
MSEHSGYDVHDDNNYDWDDDADEEPVAPPIFARGMIRSGYDFFKGAPQLRFPSTESESTILERVGVSALTPGMVIPKLKFKTGAVKGFSTILTPTAYYVVGAPGANLTSTLHLGYATTRGDNPLCITFPYQTGEHSILALSDTAIGGEILGPTAMKEITKNGTIALAAPSNPHRQSSRDLGTSQLNRGSDQLAGGRKDMAPLQRALHHNRWKLSMLTNNDPDIKVTNPTLLTRIRNQQANTIIPTLPVMQSDILPKFIQMIWCVTLDFSGTGKKADAVHPSHFFRPDANGDLSTFKCIEDFRDCIDNIQAVCMAVFMEDKASVPFFSRIFLPLRDKFRASSHAGSLGHLSCNFMAYELAIILNKWADLYKNGDNVNRPFKFGSLKQ